MKPNYVMGGIGGLIYSLNAILFVALQYLIYFDDVTFIVFAVLISTGLVLVGIGLLGFYKEEGNFLALAIFIFSLCLGVIYIFHYSVVRLAFYAFRNNAIICVSFEIAFALFSVFFMVFGIFSIIYRKLTRFQVPTLIAGIILLGLGVLSLVFTTVLFAEDLRHESLRYNCTWPAIKVLTSQPTWEGISQLTLLILILDTSTSQVNTAASLLLHGAFLPLGVMGIWICTLFFIESARHLPKIKTEGDVKQLEEKIMDASLVYGSIKYTKLASFLGCGKKELLDAITRMVKEGKVKARIDYPIISFITDQKNKN